MVTKNKQKITVLILITISLGYFGLFVFPNITGSENVEMVAVFEPDEAVPIPYVFAMIQPTETFKQALIHFAFYRYYFYGYPYFAVSGLLLFPLHWLNQLNNIPLVMLVLRQMVSVLPMLLSIWLLVYLQTHFKGYRAVVLFVLLLSIPAVIQNNLWWHPDGLAIFFAMLTIFFLDKDALCFGKFFYLAAVMCGISAGTKGIGFYFFLTIFVYLLMGYFTKKADLRRLIPAALGFLVCMAGAYLLVNPTLVYASVRERYFKVMFSQSDLLMNGYQVVYQKGFLTAVTHMAQDYAMIPLLMGVFGLCIWQMIKGQNRLLHAIILSYAIPITMTVCFLIHYKFQYWLPVALPLFSTVAVLLPEKIDLKTILHSRKTITWLGMMLAALFLIQFGMNLKEETNIYLKKLHREENSASIQFFPKAVEKLKALPQDSTYYVYHDVRIYVPSTQDWYNESTFELLDDDYIAEKQFDILLLSQQRVDDYRSSKAEGLDKANFAKSQQFYRDANKGEIKGYSLIYRNDYGLVFVRDDLYAEYLIGGK